MRGRGFQITVDDRELIQALNLLEHNVQNVILDFLKTEALVWQKEVRRKLTQNKSVKSGDLRRSIAIVKKSKWNYVVGTNLFYAPYVEYGTRRGNRPKPYFEPVYDARKAEFKSTITAMIREALT